MNKTSTKEDINYKKNKFIASLITIFVLSAIIVTAFLVTALDNRKLPNKESSQKESAIRGNIMSRDGFNICMTKKLYKATIDTRCIDPDKKELFIKLFSIYSDMPEEIIKNKLNTVQKPGILVLSYSIDSRTAKNLNELSYKLKRLDVFRAIYINEQRIIHGLDIIESGEQRIFPYGNSMTPVIGYLSKYEKTDDFAKNKDSFTKNKGVKGLEKFYDDYLNKTDDGILRGERDVL